MMTDGLPLGALATQCQSLRLGLNHFLNLNPDGPSR